MNSEIKGKINTVGKIGYVITIISKILVIAGIVGLCLAGIVGIALPKDAIDFSMSGDMQIRVSGKLIKGKLPLIGGLDDLENGSVTLEGRVYEAVSLEETDDGVIVNMKGEGANFNVRQLLGRACVMGLIYLTAVLVMLCYLKSLMREFKTCDTPFIPAVITRMKNFAWSLIPMGVLSGFSFDTDVLGSAMSGFRYTINLSVVLTILVVFALVQVFRYGAQLQQQADETL